MCDNQDLRVLVQVYFVAEKEVSLSATALPLDSVLESGGEESELLSLLPHDFNEREGRLIVTAMAYCAECGLRGGSPAGFATLVPVPKELSARAEEGGVDLRVFVIRTVLVELAEMMVSRCVVGLVFNLDFESVINAESDSGFPPDFLGMFFPGLEDSVH